MVEIAPKIERCPCCGTALGHVDRVIWNPDRRVIETPLGVISMTPQQAVLFDLIWRNRPKRQGIAAMINAVWGLRPDGGPDSAAGVVYVQLCALRKKLRPIGLNITCTGRKDSYFATVFSNAVTVDKRILRHG